MTDMGAGQGIFNGDVLQLAGLGVIQGKGLQDAFTTALTQNAEAQTKQIEMQKYKRQQQVQQILPQILSKVDFTNPKEAFATLVPLLGAEDAARLVKAQTDASQENRLQQTYNMVLGTQQGQPSQPGNPAAGGNPIADPTGGGGGVAPGSSQGMQQGGMNIQTIPDDMLIKGMVNPALAPVFKAELDRRKSSGDDQRNAKKEDRQLEYKIGGDFDAASKNFIQVRDGFSNLRTAAQDRTPSGDIQLIYSFMKTQDPGSTVREGEFATAKNTAGISDKIINLYNNTLNGTRLSDKQRDEFLRLGQKNYDVGLSQQNKLADAYRKKASRFGLQPDNVVSDYSIIDANPTQQSSDQVTAPSTPPPGFDNTPRPPKWYSQDDPGYEPVTNVMPNPKISAVPAKGSALKSLSNQELLQLMHKGKK